MRHRISKALMSLVTVGIAVGCATEEDMTGPDRPGSPTTTADANAFTDWSAPVNLGTVVNSPYIDFTPEISTDELSLYFSSNRPGGFGAGDVWVAHRASISAEWTAPVNVGPLVNGEGNDGAPHLSRDGHELFFTSNRPGGSGDNDLWVSWRADTRDDLGWGAPVNLGSAVNSDAFDAGASRWGPELYFTSNRATGDALDVYVSRVRGRTFAPGILVAELSSDGNDLRPSVRFDGREIFLSSDRAGSVDGSQDIWGSTRRDPAEPWATPARLSTVINTEFQELQPALSKDAKTLYFASDRPGGSGDIDLYVTARDR